MWGLDHTIAIQQIIPKTERLEEELLELKKNKCKKGNQYLLVQASINPIWIILGQVLLSWQLQKQSLKKTSTNLLRLGQEVMRLTWNLIDHKVQVWPFLEPKKCKKKKNLHQESVITTQKTCFKKLIAQLFLKHRDLIKTNQEQSKMRL